MVFGDGVPHTERQFILRAGEPQRWTLEVPNAKRVQIIAAVLTGTVTPTRVDLETRAADGRVLASWKQSWVQAKSPRPVWVHQEATQVKVSAAGLVGEAALPSENEGRVEVTLRPRR